MRGKGSTNPTRTTTHAQHTFKPSGGLRRDQAHPTGGTQCALCGPWASESGCSSRTGRTRVRSACSFESKALDSQSRRSRSPASLPIETTPTPSIRCNSWPHARGPASARPPPCGAPRTGSWRPPWLSTRTTPRPSAPSRPPCAARVREHRSRASSCARTRSRGLKVAAADAQRRRLCASSSATPGPSQSLASAARAHSATGLRWRRTRTWRRRGTTGVMRGPEGPESEFDGASSTRTRAQRPAPCASSKHSSPPTHIAGPSFAGTRARTADDRNKHPVGWLPVPDDSGLAFLPNSPGRRRRRRRPSEAAMVWASLWGARRAGCVSVEMERGFAHDVRSAVLCAGWVICAGPQSSSTTASARMTSARAPTRRGRSLCGCGTQSQGAWRRCSRRGVGGSPRCTPWGTGGGSIRLGGAACSSSLVGPAVPTLRTTVLSKEMTGK